MLKIKKSLLFSAISLLILFLNISPILADDCSCGSSKVVLGSYGLEDQCRKDCIAKGYQTYNYGTANNKPTSTPVPPSNPSNLGGGCYCDGTYIGNLGVEDGCKKECLDRKSQNYNYEEGGDKSTGITTPPKATGQASQASSFEYNIMESLPGTDITKDKSYDFNAYVSGIYDFGIAAVGIAALLMLSIGAFMYLTSAGNNAAMASAKGVITDALIGLILALFAWLLLNIINPDLSGPTGITGTGGVSPAAVPGATGSVTSPSFTMKKISAMNNINADGTINFSKAVGDPGLKTSVLCNDYKFDNNQNVDPAQLKTIAHLESGGCSMPTAVSPKGACGLMQIMPSTAKSLDSSLNGMSNSHVCDYLRNNPQASINLAAMYVAKNQNSAGVQATKKEDQFAAVCAGYNSGYSTTPGSSPSGKNPGLAKSVNCTTTDTRAFECSKNPGGLVESISYAYNCVGLYALYKK